MKLLHNILRGSTLATALFVFQSCYGMPQNVNDTLFYEATVKVTDGSGKAIAGVKASARNADMTTFADQSVSDADGLLRISIAVPESARAVDIRFEAEGYAVNDTTIEDVTSPEPDFTVKLQKGK